MTPHPALTPYPAWCLSKNLEEYFWNEVSNALSHFYESPREYKYGIKLG